jgi:hypothetical protein
MKVKIIGPVISEEKVGKKGPYTTHRQEAMFETSGFRMTAELDVESPSKGYVVGETYEVDVEAQMKPGRYGVELPRFFKLSAAVPLRKAG